MFTLIRTLGLETALARELPPLIAAFLLAELFYKFGSFALECLAFLATWYVLSAIWSLLSKGTGKD
ncbi:hypothetical protein EHS39_28270 [Ensifer sp. MPMI2T]|nr:hypothetical protein EHS39_28270 [Ensifer sp. MPMI2T]